MTLFFDSASSAKRPRPLGLIAKTEPQRVRVLEQSEPQASVQSPDRIPRSQAFISNRTYKLPYLRNHFGAYTHYWYNYLDDVNNNGEFE
jgi:hypothetical protein